MAEPEKEKSPASDSELEGEGPNITINLKSLDASVRTISVPLNITVGELKKRIQDRYDVPVASQRLIFFGKALKDDQLLSSYSIEDGHTIHMVARPPGAQEQQQPQRSPQPTPAARTAPSATPGTAPPPPFGLFGRAPGSVVMSAISIPPEGAADLSSLVAGVINSLSASGAFGQSPAGAPPAAGQPPQAGAAGQAAGPTAPAPSSTPPPTLFDTIRGSLNTLNNHITTANSISSVEPMDLTHPNTPNTVETIGQLLGQYQEALARVQPVVSRLSLLLSHESQLQDPELRQETQRLAQATQQSLQQLGTTSQQMGHLLHTVGLGTTPGQAQPATPPPAGRGPMQGNIAIHINDLIGGNGPAGIAVPVFIHPPGTAPPGATPVPLNSAAQPPQAQAAQQPPQGGQPGPNPAGRAPPPNPLAGIHQLLGPFFQQLQNPSGGASPAASPMGMLMNMFGRPPGAAGAGAGQTGQAGPATQAGQTGQGATSTPTPVAADAPASSPSVARAIPPSLSSRIPVPDMSGTSQSGALMAQMYQAVLQALQDGGSATASTILEGLSLPDESQQPTGPFEEMMMLIVRSLSLRDIMSVVNGDWQPLEKVHSVLKTHLTTALNGNLSPYRLSTYADGIVSAIQVTLDERNLPDDIRQRIVPGRNVNITETALSIVRAHVYRLVTIIMNDFPTSASTSSSSSSSAPVGSPFAQALRLWTMEFIGDLFSRLSTLFLGGTSDVYLLLRFFLTHRLTGLVEGPMLEISTNLIANNIMNTYNNFLEQSVRYPVETEWSKIMEEDEARQQTSQFLSQLSEPLSESYLSGFDLQRKKKGASSTSTSQTSTPSATNLEDMMEDVE